jgi:hypothetical protein
MLRDARRSGVAPPGSLFSATREKFLSAEEQLTYFEYKIDIAQDGTRFTARVTREGGLIEHDGHASEVWASASCGSRDRAIWVAKNAIDSDKIR